MNKILNVQGELEEKFGNYRDFGWTDAWAHLPEKYPIGTTVTGSIKLICAFGCFLDIGVGFPALVFTHDIAPTITLVPKEYERVMKVGMTLTVKICAYVNEHRQIRVTQKQ